MKNLQSHVNSRILSSPEEFRTLLPEWKKLYSECNDSTPFQHPDWLMAWIYAFCPHRLLGVEVREGSRLIGFAPLLVYPRNGEQVLAFAGGGVSDYLGLLADPGRESLVIGQLLSTVQMLPDWDVIDLTDIHSSSCLLQSHLFPTKPQKHDLCFVLPLPASPDQLLEGLSKRQWANLRNARSRTRREQDVRFEVAPPEQSLAFMDDLFRLHSKRWNGLGESGVLHEERVQRFHRAVAPGLVSAGMLRLYRMRAGDRVMAVVYCFFHRTSAFCYLQGFDPECAHLSPGTQLMLAVMEDAIRHGLYRFDFLRGTEAYKMHWRPLGEPTYRIEMSRYLLPRTLPLAS